MNIPFLLLTDVQARARIYFRSCELGSTFGVQKLLAADHGAEFLLLKLLDSAGFPVYSQPLYKVGVRTFNRSLLL